MNPGPDVGTKVPPLRQQIPTQLLPAAPLCTCVICIGCMHGIAHDLKTEILGARHSAEREERGSWSLVHAEGLTVYCSFQCGEVAIIALLLSSHSWVANRAAPCSGLALGISQPGFPFC